MFSMGPTRTRQLILLGKDTSRLCKLLSVPAVRISDLKADDNSQQNAEATANSTQTVPLILVDDATVNRKLNV